MMDSCVSRMRPHPPGPALILMKQRDNVGSIRKVQVQSYLSQIRLGSGVENSHCVFNWCYSEYMNPWGDGHLYMHGQKTHYRSVIVKPRIFLI